VPEVGAQNPPAQRVNNFSKIFQNPTGQNGYEELVRAGDILLSSPVWVEFERMDGAQAPTLATKRRVVFDSACRAALDMLKAGLQKPVRSPREKLDEETPLPELSAFRSLARLLGHEIYVQLADGRVSQAVDTLGLALKFGYVVQVDTLIAGLVAIAVDAIAIRPIGDHLEQLSVRDCDKLLAIARDWMLLPDPAIAILQADKQHSLDAFRKYKADPVKLLKMLDPGSLSPQSKKRIDDLEQSYSQNPNLASASFDEAARLLSGQYDHAIASLSQPQWERKPFPPIDTQTEAGFLASEYGGGAVLLRVLDRYTREMAQVQLLGVHAAIRRRLWEYNALPGSLDELKLGKMIVDPFSGRPFEYKRLVGNKYTLSSIGPVDPTSSSGDRTPIRLGPQ
jgi:hypothetical protein